LDVFGNNEETHISVRLTDVAPVLCIVAVEIVAGVTLSALEILTYRWGRFCALGPSNWRSKRRKKLLGTPSDRWRRFCVLWQSTWRPRRL